MSYLTRQEKMKIVLELCEKLNITAYQIGGNTPLNTSGVQRILNKEVNPQAKTVDILYDYVIKRKLKEEDKKSPKITGSTIPIEEPATTYGNSIEELVARQVQRSLQPLFKDLAARQEDCYRLMSKVLLNLDHIEQELEELKSNTNDIREVVHPKK